MLVHNSIGINEENYGNNYHIAGKFGGGKAWRIGHLEVLARKSLVNVDDLLDGVWVWRVLIGK